MADELRVEREDDLITLADCSIANVHDQLPELTKLEESNPALAAEIALIIRSEVRSLEINFSLLLSDLRKSFEEDLARLPADHMLNVMADNDAAAR